MNQINEFPMECKVSTRVSCKTKRLIKTLKQKGHNERDIIEYGAVKLANEPTLLEWEIGELDVKINRLEAEIYALKSKKQAKINRMKIVAPNLLDEDVLNNLLIESAREYAVSIVDDDFDMGRLDSKLAKSSIMSQGKEWGYDPLEFLEEVRNQVNILCQTERSDI